MSPKRRPSLAARRHRRRRGGNGQSMVEFVLVAPIFLLMMFLLIDFGRLLYALSGISSAARTGARTLSLKADEDTDCYAYQIMERVGQAFPLQADPNAVTPDNDPNSPAVGNNPTAVPPEGVGMIYIYPAVATATPPDGHPQCAGGQRSVSSTTRQVAVQVTYNFVPWTPLVKLISPHVLVHTISITQTEY